VPTHASALAIGHTLQEYIIGRLLGHGGFGLTYLAQDTNLNALVAIKEFLPQEFALRGPDSHVVPKSEFDADSYKWGLDRFKEEARALARFKHPNIVRVSRLIEANGTAYMVMDFEPGMTLSQYLKRHGPTLDEGRLLGLFLPVLDGLEALHRLQLVHRDIKPSNIYVRAYGGPMLIDFGAVRQAVGAHSQNLTSLVTPGYAPIEQYSTDGRQGAWSDIYAVGASIYYCMFGHAPADAARRSATMSDGGEDPYAVAVKEGRDRYSRELLECVDWALQFRQRERPQSAHEIRERMRTSPVPPQVIEVPESLQEVPELQHGIMSAPTMPSQRVAPAMLPPIGSRSTTTGLLKPGDATQISEPTSLKNDTLAPLIEGTRRVDRPPREPLLPQLRAKLADLGKFFAASFKSPAHEPQTLTARFTRHLREPRSVRIAVTAVVVLGLASSILSYNARIGGEQQLYEAAVTAGTVDAFQAYLRSCGSCVHRAEAQTALDRLQLAAQAMDLEARFKDLLAKKALAVPAEPNATAVLKQWEVLAPDDARIPKARAALAEALQAEARTTAPRGVLPKTSPQKRLATSTANPASRKPAPAKGSGSSTKRAANEQLPKPVYTPAPKYPSSATGKVKGWVELEFTVNVDGSTSDVEVVDASPKGVFDDAAMHAVHSWVFTPYTLGGERQRHRIRMRVDFKP
jgi:TonB family protein